MKQAIQTDLAPQARGRYSQGIHWRDLLFVSGQLPIDPLTGEIVPGGIREQTERALLNLQAVVVAGGSSLKQVLKTTLYITAIADWDEVNAVYASFFGDDPPPARAVVPVKELHFGALVEIEAITATASED